MYDSTCKFIALEYSRDLATWLLGKPLELTEIKPSELSLEPSRYFNLFGVGRINLTYRVPTRP